MRIEKFEDQAVAIDDNMAIWFRKCWIYRSSDNQCIWWVFAGANEGDKHWSMYTKENFEAIHPGIIDDILRRLNDEQNE